VFSSCVHHPFEVQRSRFSVRVQFLSSEFGVRSSVPSSLFGSTRARAWTPNHRTSTRTKPWTSNWTPNRTLNTNPNW